MRCIGPGTMLAALIAGATFAAAQTGPAGFKSPSGNIHCQYYDGEIRCDIAQQSAPVPPKPRDCELEWGQAFAVADNGRSGERLCHGDTVVDARLPVLAYGNVWRSGGITCASEQTGVTCTNAAGHGFSLSRAAQRLF